MKLFSYIAHFLELEFGLELKFEVFFFFFLRNKFELIFKKFEFQKCDT